jgi:hypothetical protein
MTLDQTPVGLVTRYGEVGRELSSPDNPAGALLAIARLAVRRVPGTGCASVTRR